jgi:thymidylate kinase
MSAQPGSTIAGATAWRERPPPTGRAASRTPATGSRELVIVGPTSPGSGPNLGLFIALEGNASVDTPAVTQEAGRLLRTRGLPVVDFDEHHPPLVSPELDRHLAALDNMIRQPRPHEPDIHLSDDHWVYLRLAWHTAVAHSVIEPLLDTGHIVLVDTWTATYLAQLSLRTRSNMAQIRALFDRLIQPDAVVHLNIPRRTATKPAHSTPGPAGGSTAYHERVAEILTTFARKEGWRTIDITGLSSEGVAEKVALTVQKIVSLDHPTT